MMYTEENLFELKEKLSQFLGEAPLPLAGNIHSAERENEATLPESTV